MAGFRPTHSSTVWVPSPPVSSRTCCDALVAALGDHVGGAEFAAEVGAVRVPAHQDDPFGAEPLRGQDGGQPDRAVADDGHGGPRGDAGGDGAVVAGREDVGQGQQRRQQRGVLADGQLDQGALGLRDADRFALAAVDAVAAPVAAVPAGGLQALAAEVAGVVRPDERRDHEVAGASGRTRRRRRPRRRRGTRGRCGGPARWRASIRTATGRCRRCSRAAPAPPRRWVAAASGRARSRRGRRRRRTSRLLASGASCPVVCAARGGGEGCLPPKPGSPQASLGREADPLRELSPWFCRGDCWPLSCGAAWLSCAGLAAQLASRFRASCVGDPGSAV